MNEPGIASEVQKALKQWEARASSERRGALFDDNLVGDGDMSETLMALGAYQDFKRGQSYRWKAATKAAVTKACFVVHWAR